MIKLLILQFFVLIINSACPSDDGFCISCQSDQCAICIGSYPDSSGSCTYPQVHVLGCISYNASQECIGCKYGYYLASDGKCYLIPDSSCFLWNNLNECIMCRDGGMPINGLCSSTAACNTANCSHCILDPRIGEVCSTCVEGYSLFLGEEKIGRCLKTNDETSNCWILNAYDPSRCVVCRYNFYHKDGKCVTSTSYWVDMGIQRTFIYSLLLVFIIVSII